MSRAQDNYDKLIAYEMQKNNTQQRLDAQRSMRQDGFESLERSKKDNNRSRERINRANNYLALKEKYMTELGKSEKNKLDFQKELISEYRLMQGQVNEFDKNNPLYNLSKDGKEYKVYSDDGDGNLQKNVIDEAQYLKYKAQNRDIINRKKDLVTATNKFYFDAKTGEVKTKEGNQSIKQVVRDVYYNTQADDMGTVNNNYKNPFSLDVVPSGAQTNYDPVHKEEKKPTGMTSSGGISSGANQGVNTGKGFRDKVKQSGHGSGRMY